MCDNKRKTKSGLRGVTRFFAVQMIYQSEISGVSIDAIVKNVKSNEDVTLSEYERLNGIDIDFFSNLMKNVSENLVFLDQVISRHLSDSWRIDRLDLVMKSILRLGVTELLFFKDAPSNVVFNEYIEIAKSFFEKSDVSFVNGLLNSVSKENNCKS